MEKCVHFALVHSVFLLINIYIANKSKSWKRTFHFYSIFGLTTYSINFEAGDGRFFFFVFSFLLFYLLHSIRLWKSWLKSWWRHWSIQRCYVCFFNRICCCFSFHLGIICEKIRSKFQFKLRWWFFVRFINRHIPLRIQCWQWLP